MTLEFTGSCILLDVEGTTSSVSYVYDVLFPYARKQLNSFLTQHWKEENVQRVRELIAKDAGDSQIENDIARVEEEVNRQMDHDAKSTGLKELQGLIWTEGYNAGELCSHVYNDVAPAIKAWKNAGLSVRIYSSGSVTAQKIFFANSEAGNLLQCIDGHYDTQIGPKRSSESYAAIAADMGMSTEEVLFLSDVIEELRAASNAGMMAALVVRPGNAPVQDGHSFQLLHSFSEITANSRARA